MNIEKNLNNIMMNFQKTPYYQFDADAFVANYRELESAFRAIYPKYQIGYSFKTNYTPAVCELVKQLGAYAEVVSDMEYTLAKKIGYTDNKIIYNGPIKGECLAQCILNGGLLNVDNFAELDRVVDLAKIHPDKLLNIGLRVNFDIGNGLHSRFGIDTTNGDLERALAIVSEIPNLYVQGLHFHISRARGVDAWERRIRKILDISEKHFNNDLKYIDIGSGMYGHLDAALQEQFGATPSYEDYAKAVATVMANHYSHLPDDEKPMLITEPGTTVVSKYFHLFSTIVDIKQIRDKEFALLDCSFHNVGEICGLKKIPLEIISCGSKKAAYHKNIDFVGYTCLEQDVIYHGYDGPLNIGDIVEFYNVGGYSIVEKPPFIHPDIPVYMTYKSDFKCIKREQTFEDIFAPFYFCNI